MLVKWFRVRLRFKEQDNAPVSAPLKAIVIGKFFGDSGDFFINRYGKRRSVKAERLFLIQP